MVSRIPIDRFVGVKTHRLNELWSDGSGTTFTKWLHGRGKRFTTDGSWGVHVVPDKQFEKQKDTWITFCGPGETKSPQQRDTSLFSDENSTGFKLISTDDLARLTDSSEPGHARILRLIARSLAPKKAKQGASPVKAKPAACDEEEPDDEMEEEDDAEEEEEQADESPGKPWLQYSKKILWSTADKLRTKFTTAETELQVKLSAAREQRDDARQDLREERRLRHPDKLCAGDAVHFVHLG